MFQLIFEPKRRVTSVVTHLILTFSITLFLNASTQGQPTDSQAILKVEAGRFPALSEPPCSYCVNQHRKALIDDDDRVVAWLRAAHNGGAVPLRHFLSASRVINDTYGLFFYDPDGGYVSAFPKDYGYQLYGWKRGVMVVKGEDGTLWSGLTGIAFEGPQKGRKLQRIPSLVTNWQHWMLLHPESTAYDLFDGQRYPVTALPTELSAEAIQTMGQVDSRLKPMQNVLGVEGANVQKAYPLDALPDRACVLDKLGDRDIAVLWFGPTKTAVAFDRRLGDRTLTLYADKISPETAPFKDKETGTRWTLAGRAVDGPLRGAELTWVSSVQCRWYAWAAEYPETKVEQPSSKTPTQAAVEPSAKPFRAALLSQDQVNGNRLRSLQASGIRTVVLQVSGAEDAVAAEQEACRRIVESGLELRYWIEVARCPQLADAEPLWMASLQGHPEWRRLFPDVPQPAAGSAIRVYPWVPILNEEPFQAQLQRITDMLAKLPEPVGVFLNDLQGAPSACGCGHHLCRWTSDYGKIRTTTALGPTAAADFVASVQKLLPNSELIPVWVTECEKHDGDEHGLCAGVACFNGICWKAWTEQLLPVAETSAKIGVLLPYKAFDRDLPIYGETAGWIGHALKTFQSMPQRYQQPGIHASRLIAVLQGWDVTEQQIAAQIDVAERSHSAGYVVAYSKIEQSWQPQSVR